MWSCAEDRTLRRWSIAEQKEVERVDLPTATQRDRWTGVALSPGAKEIALIGRRSFEARYVGGVTRSFSTALMANWRSGSGRPQWLFELPNDFPREPVFSPDGRLIASFVFAGAQSGQPDRIVLFTASDGHEVDSLPIEDGRVRSLAFSPDGKRLAAGMDAGDALVFDVSQAQEAIE